MLINVFVDAKRLTDSVFLLLLLQYPLLQHNIHLQQLKRDKTVFIVVFLHSQHRLEEDHALRFKSKKK